jgi:hypothetical protein
VRSSQSSIGISVTRPPEDSWARAAQCFTLTRLRSCAPRSLRSSARSGGSSGTLRYLPPYSRDLNPIELSYSAFKAFLRKCAERTEEALRRRVGQFVRRLSAKACANFFAHAGYAAI